MSVNRYDPEDWGGLHMVPKPDGDWVCYEAWEHVNRQIAALKEENERLSDGLSHHMNISQVLADGNANMYEMVMERDAEIELLKARVAELEAKDPNLINTCGCRFENDTGNSVLLCEACSELPCHNPNAETKEPANARRIAASAEGRTVIFSPMGGGEFMTSKLDKELTNRLGNSSIESCIQRAESWMKVSALLDELVPDWKNDSATTRGGEALNAISGLVTRIADLERDLEHINDALEEREAELYGAAVAPDVQGEPVAVLLIGDPEHTEQGWELGDWDIEPNATAIEAFARLAGPGAYQLYLAPQPAEPSPSFPGDRKTPALAGYPGQTKIQRQNEETKKMKVENIQKATDRPGARATQTEAEHERDRLLHELQTAEHQRDSLRKQLDEAKGRIAALESGCHTAVLERQVEQLETMVKIFRSCIETGVYPARESPCHKLIQELTGNVNGEADVGSISR